MQHYNLFLCMYTHSCIHVLFIVEIHVEPPNDTPADEPLPPNKRPPNLGIDEPDGSSIEEGEQIINISIFSITPIY